MQELPHGSWTSRSLGRGSLLTIALALGAAACGSDSKTLGANAPSATGGSAGNSQQQGSGGSGPTTGTGGTSQTNGGGGSVDPSTIRTVRDEELADGTIELSAPAAGAMIVDTRSPTLIWQAAPGAEKYQVWLNITRTDYDWNASGNLLDRYTKVAEVTGTSYKTEELSDRWTYKWFIVALDAQSKESHSKVGTFSVYLPNVEQIDDGVPLIAGARDLNKNGSIEPFEDWKQPVNTRVSDLLNRLSDEEKALQLFYNFKEEPRAGWQMGPIGGAQEIHDWLVKIGNENKFAIPFITAGDTTHGFHTTFPVGVGVAATREPALAFRLGEMERLELAVSGQRGVLGPIAEVGTKVLYPRIQEGWGEDAELAAAMTRAMIAGFQAGPEINPRSIVPTTKHWPGEGAGGEGAIVYDAVTIKWHMKPWYAAIEANTGSIMPGYAGARFLDPPTQCTPACGSGQVCFKNKCMYGGHGGGDSPALIDYLRTTMKYDGVVTTDWLPSGAWLGATSAGSDVMGGADPKAPDFSMQDFLSKVPTERLNEAVRRVLSLKIRLGLFENPYPELERVEDTWKAPAHKDLAIEATAKSLTLLRNEGALPLKLQAGDVLLVTGPAAINKAEPYADDLVQWDGSANFYSIWTSYFHGSPGKAGPASTLFDGLVERATQDNVKVVNEGDPDAGKAKAVVLGLGEPSYTHRVYWHEKDGKERIVLSPDQLALLDKYTAGSVPVIAVLILPRPIVISDWHTKVKSLVVAYRPGDGAGRGVAQLLFGDVTPRGKLPFQLPRSEDQVGEDKTETAKEHWDLPYDLGASAEERQQIRSLIDQGKPVPSTFGDPLYPFGAGLDGF